MKRRCRVARIISTTHGDVGTGEFQKETVRARVRRKINRRHFFGRCQIFVTPANKRCDTLIICQVPIFVWFSSYALGVPGQGTDGSVFYAFTKYVRTRVIRFLFTSRGPDFTECKPNLVPCLFSLQINIQRFLRYARSRRPNTSTTTAAVASAA